MPDFSEKIDFSILFKKIKLLDSLESDVQKISLYEHKLLGKILVINNEVQHVEVWAPLYHELIVHLPSAFIPNIKNVLILGGGSLFAASEILKYPSVQNVHLVDHDENVIEVVRKNYSHAPKVLCDDRFKLFINDAFNQLHQTMLKYDLIINDSVDLINHGRKINLELVSLLSTKLTKQGICCDLVYRSIFEKSTTLTTIKKLRKFQNSAFSLVAVPEYPGIFHILCMWSSNNRFISARQLVNKVQLGWIKERRIRTKYYNPEYLNYYLYLPTYLKDILGRTI